MSDGEISIRFASEEDAQLWDAFVKVQKQARAAGTSLDTTNAAAGRVDASLRRFAERAKDLNATPLEALSRETNKLDAALKGNLLTQDQHSRAVAAAHGKYQEQLRQTYAAQEKLNQQQGGPLPSARPAADPAARAIGDKLTQDNATPLERYHQRLLRVRQAYAATTVSAVTFQRESAKALEDLNRELAKTHDTTSEADRDLRKFAATVKQVETTPLERYNQQLAKIDQAVKKNLLTTREAQAAAKRAADEYQAEAGQSERAARKVGLAARESAGGAQAAFGNMKVGVLAAWGAVGATVTKILGDIRAEAEKAGQSLSGQAASGGTLAQLANSPEELQELRRAAKKVRAGGGAASMDEANRFVFSMKSAGAMDEIDTFTKAKNLGVMQQPEEMIKYAAAVRTSFGAQQAGSFQDVVNRSLVAAGSSPEEASQVLKGTARAGVAAQQQGASVDETMALVSVMSRATGSAEEAGSKVAALMRGLAKYEPEKDAHGQLKAGKPLDETFRGQSISDVLKNEKLAALSPADLQKLLGSDEAVQTLGVARENAAELRALTAGTRRGREEDLLGNKMAAVESDPALAAAAKLTRVQGAVEVKSEARGTRALQAEAAQASLVQTMRDTPDESRSHRAAQFMVSPIGAVINKLQGNGEVRAAAASIGATASRYVGGDAAFMSLIAKLTGASEATDRSARAQADAAESLQRSARRLEQSLSADRPPVTDWSRAARAEAALAPE